MRSVMVMVVSIVWLWGQVEGIVEVRVKDEKGKGLGGIEVRMERAGGGRVLTGVTNEEGWYEFRGMGEGAYRVRVIGQGFSMEERGFEGKGERRVIELVLRPRMIAEEMVVRGNAIAGFPEQVERIAGSVQVIGRKELEESRVFTFSEALRKATGVNVRDEEGFGLRPNIGIRGLNPTRSGKVLLLEDGIPLTYAPYGDNASYYHPPIERIESIEVLKGSGQIIYGPVTVGGVINYLTPNAPDRQTAEVMLIGGNRSYFNGRVTYGGSAGPAGWIINYLRKQGEGSRENTRSGLNDVNVKAVLGLGSRQALTVKSNYYGEDSNVTYSGLREDEYRAAPRSNPFRNDFFYGDRWGGSVSHALVLGTNAALTTNFYGSYFDRRWWRQSSNSGQRPNDAADPSCGGMQNLNTTCGNEGRLRKYHSWGIDPRLRAGFGSSGLRHQLDAGFRYHFENQDRRQENGERPLSRSGVLVENNLRQNSAWSGFFQDRIGLRRFAVTPGLRVERVNFLRTNRLGAGGAGVTGTTRITQLIPGVGFSFQASEGTTLFGGIHRGFAPPRTEDIISNSTGGALDLDPELSWNYEAGMRSLIRDGLRVEAAFFRMDYQNQIIPASLAGGAGATLTNGGSTLHQGFEFNARVESGLLKSSAHKFHLTAAYTWIPVAEYTGVRFSQFAGFGAVSISGNRLPYAPRQLLNIEAGYSNPRGIDAVFEAVHTGFQFGDDLNSTTPSADGQRGPIPANTVYNAAFNYRVESLGTTFFVTVKNILDTVFIADRSRGILPGSPRLIQCGMKFRFR